MLSIQIQILRKKHKISQAQLAKVINVSPSTLGMYEQGRRTPSIETLVQLAQYFHVSLDYLITGTDYVYKYQSNGAYREHYDLQNPVART